MILKEELLEKINTAGLNSFETNIATVETVKSMIFLTNNELAELILFASSNNIKTILYSYFYADDEEYKITEEMLEDCDERLNKAIQSNVKEYNNHTQTLDFDRPFKLFVYCVYEGFKFAIAENDSWLDELLTGEEKLEELMESCSEIIVEIEIEDKNKITELQAELKEFILSDPQFILCTNQRLRRTYIITLLKDRIEYKQLFKGYQDHLDYIELLWKEYKLNKQAYV